MTATARQPSFRTILVLARASNLPTVWSNCLAGWLLGGGGYWLQFVMLCSGASLLYIGGMFLNDAFDVDFDRQWRRERPIPSNQISESEVWVWGSAFLVLGILTLAIIGLQTAVLSVLLAGCIVLYDAVHKAFTFSPVIMAACRFLLYLVAASTATFGITGVTIWSGLALACYIVGLSYIAQRESARGPLRYWPCLFLAAPIGLALIVSPGPFLAPALYYSLIVAVWVLWCLNHTFGRTHRNIGYTVSGLLGGIVLVDLLAVLPGDPWLIITFAGLFLFSRIFQRFIPAT